MEAKTLRQKLEYFIAEINKLDKQYPKMWTKDVAKSLSNILENSKD